MGLTFQSHCESLGIKLLREDTAFIKKMLLSISRHKQKSVLAEYAEIWLQAMNETDIVYKKQNIGRRAANNFLREYKK